MAQCQTIPLRYNGIQRLPSLRKIVPSAAVGIRVTNSRASTISSAMKPEKKNGVKQEKEGQDTLDRLIQQSLGKEPFLTFPRSSDSPYQLLQLLNAFDQQESGNLCKKSQEKENFEELKENFLYNNVGISTMPSKKNGIKEPAHSLKVFGQPAKGKRSSSTMQSLRIPEAVVAFAQAAAKANGEPEKYLPGWPLLSPSKRQMQKCDKCSREYCSTINYRRHMRLHRRSLNVHKDSSKNRDFLGEFWDKLSGDEAKELVSLKCTNLEELSGSSVIKALTTWKRRPAILTSLPHLYVKAGLTLLDIIQASPSVFPVTSHELFSVLDDASENTFLCAGTALSVQKYVFDGEAVKSALEIKNLVAFTSFLIEKELVKAWLADKDAEALRCQKLLVEEEEAAQKRQADLLEAKRLKKLRVKGQKTKDTSNIMDAEFRSVPIESTSETSTNQQQQILYHSELSIGNEEIKLRLPLHENCCEKSRSFIELNANENFSPHGVTGETSPKLVFPSEEAALDMVCKTQRENDHQQQYSLRHAYLQARNLGSAFWDHQTSSVYKRHDNRDPKKPVTPPNGLKVWTKKKLGL
ncbi:hypothetical protein HPP92_001476 [Vanilla planifolia]|uniref:C2H2-type domain-containing protein n=1 Tax=Vanilla planifolia TaxID=51239 RepID=A0A835RY35_VANPL|nr:hypothetical protein HPP92_001476 [Vanilla planifolia]